jgi:hypothetical protein
MVEIQITAYDHLECIYKELKIRKNVTANALLLLRLFPTHHAKIQEVMSEDFIDSFEYAKDQIGKTKIALLYAIRTTDRKTFPQFLVDGKDTGVAADVCIMWKKGDFQPILEEAGIEVGNYDGDPFEFLSKCMSQKPMRSKSDYSLGAVVCRSIKYNEVSGRSGDVALAWDVMIVAAVTLVF